MMIFQMKTQQGNGPLEDPPFTDVDVSENSGTPKWIMVYNGKPYFLMDDLGVPLFLETPMYFSLNGGDFYIVTLLPLSGPVSSLEEKVKIPRGSFGLKKNPERKGEEHNEQASHRRFAFFVDFNQQGKSLPTYKIQQFC